MNPRKSSPGQECHAKMQITTHLTHSLADSPVTQDSSGINPNFDDSLLLNPEETEQVYVDDLLSHFMLFNSFDNIE